MKPLILVMDVLRERSPLLTQHYQYLARKDGPLEIKFCNSLNIPIDQAVWETCGDRKPDYIYWGFTHGKALRLNRDYIINNNIKIITEIGDVSSWGQCSGNFSQLKVDIIVFRAPSLDYLGERERLWISKCECFKDADIVPVPWGIDTKKYKLGRQIMRNHDIAFLCTIGSEFKYHDERRQISKILGKMKRQYKFPITKGRIFGDAYIKTLCNTKLFIVEPSMRDWLTQKYLEGAMCGCLMVGKIPTMARNVFKDGENFIEIDDWEELPGKIRSALNFPGNVHKMARVGRSVVYERFSIEKTAGILEERILEDFNCQT